MRKVSDSSGACPPGHRSNSTVRAKHFGVQSLSAPAKRVAQLQTTVAKNTVCKRYKESMGFTARTVFLSRGDPMSEEILRFLAGYDMLVHESFGQVRKDAKLCPIVFVRASTTCYNESGPMSMPLFFYSLRIAASSPPTFPRGTASWAPRERPSPASSPRSPPPRTCPRATSRRAQGWMDNNCVSANSWIL